MPQPECSFKITHLFLSLLHLNCFPLYFDDVQNAHMTCRAFLSGPCMAQGSCHPSPHPPCPDSPARLAFFVSAPRGFPLHLERWFSLSYSSPTSLLSLSSISSLWPPNLNLPHSPHSFSVHSVLSPFRLQKWLFVWEWSRRREGSLWTHLWGPCSEPLAVPPLSPWLSEFILPVLQSQPV